MPAADRTAVIASDGTFTYGDLDDAARRASTALADGRSDLAEARVAFLVPPGFAHVAVVRGIWRAGGLAVPLAVSHPAAELDYCVRDAEASIVVSDPSHGAMLEPIAGAACARFVVTTALLARSDRDIPSLPPFEASRRALIVYTSGTTGQLKGLGPARAHLAAQVGALISAWEWTR